MFLNGFKKVILLIAIFIIHQAQAYEGESTFDADGNYATKINFKVKSALSIEALVNDLFLNEKKLKLDNPHLDSFQWNLIKDKIFLKMKLNKSGVTATLAFDCTIKSNINSYGLVCNLIKMKSILGSSLTSAWFSHSCNQVTPGQYSCLSQTGGKTIPISTFFIHRSTDGLALAGIVESLSSEYHLFLRANQLEDQNKFQTVLDKIWSKGGEQNPNLGKYEELKIIFSEDGMSMDKNVKKTHLRNPASTISFAQMSEQLVSKNNGLLSPSFSYNLASNTQFEFDPELNVYSTINFTQPEIVQNYFSFNWELFLKQQGTNNPLEATRNYYRKSSRRSGSLRLYTDTPTLGDWMGLIHPPVHEAVPPKLHPSHAFKNADFHRRVDQLTNTHLTSGNKVDLLENKETFDAKIRMLSEAKKFFWGSSLLFSCDAVTEPLIQLLIARAQEGIDVRLIVDASLDLFGHHACTKRLKDSGVKLIRAKGFIFKNSAFHVKIWIKDGEEALVDGANTIDSEAASTGYNHLYRDTGLLIQGPAATDLTHEMVELIQRYGHQEVSDEVLNEIKIKVIAEENVKLRGIKNYEQFLEEPKGVCRVVVQSAASEYDRVSEVFHQYLINSQKRFLGATVEKTFEFDSKNGSKWHHILFQDLLEKSKTLGYQSDLIMNTWLSPFSAYSLPNSSVSDLNHSTFITRFIRNQREKKQPSNINHIYDYASKLEEMKSSLHLWSHFQYIHSKVIFLDDEVVSIGSFNLFDKRADRDAEVAILCQDLKLNLDFQKSFNIGLLNSIPILAQ